MPPVDLSLTFLAPTDAPTTLVRWESPVIGVRQSHFDPPFTHPLLDLVLRALDQSQTSRTASGVFTPAEQQQLAQLGLWHTEADAGGLPADLAVRVGQHLYRAITADPQAAIAFASVRDYAHHTNMPLALHLRFPPRAVELAALPWETLSDQDGIALLLGQGRAAACTRYLDLEHALPPPPVRSLPLRVLVISPHAGIPTATRIAEQQVRWQAWEPLLKSRRIVVHEISPATREQLLHALRILPTPDVVHYYGHGRYQDGTAALLLDAPDGGEDWLEVQACAALLGQVRLLVLFACQGASLNPAHSMLRSLAPALSAAGVQAVLAMQVAVRVHAATRASSVLYRALASGWSMQQATALVRQTLYIHEPDQASWYVPVLYVRASTPQPVYLLPPAPTAAANAGTHAPDLPYVPDTPDVLPAPAPSSSRPMRWQAPRQQIIARQRSQIKRVRLTASGAAEQLVEASDNSQISDVQAHEP